jgi:PAS domain S-box-containing protein
MTANHYCSLMAALLDAPVDRPFITMWHEEDYVQTATFGQFIHSAKSVAAKLRAEGLGSGDAVILIMPQDIPLMAAFAGAMLAGAVPAILAYPNFKVDPVKYSSGLAGVSENLKASLVVVDDAFPAELSGHLHMSASTRLIRAVTNSTSLPETFVPDNVWEPEKLAFIQHSAGTTGLQKGVALSHAAVLTQLEHLASALEISDQDRIYSWLPLYHDMGLIACFMLPLVYHLPVVMHSPTEWVLRPGTMLKLISEYRCTLAWTPNFALQFLARRVQPKDANHYDLSSLRALINCSEPVRARSIDEFQTVYAPLGLRPDALKSSYAMAENVFAVTQSEVHGLPRRVWISASRFWKDHLAVSVVENSQDSLCFVSSGRCLAGNQVRIVSSDGTDLSDGRVGEILISSDSCFRGYYNRPDLTAKAFHNGWYRSGDLGFCLEGELYVIGRKNDLIIVAGKNIYPQDIEEIVFGHPAIHDGRAIAFGLYNPDLGTDDIIVVAEAETEQHLKAAREIELALRNAIVAELDVTPRAIYLRPPKWIVKSTAGKPARSTTREKLLLEQPELIGKGHEHLFELLPESVMTRTVEGRINFWNRCAEELYGWRKDEAVGAVSHHLLQTQFPKPLEEIESELARSGRWEGKLVHATRDGDRVVVESRWILDRGSQPGAVLEINRRSDES